MISGIDVLPSRPFSADELREFLLRHSDCKRIHLFPEASLEAVCTEFGFTRHVIRNIVVLDLTQSEEALWADLNPKRRNGIRYARKHGVIARPATSSDRDATVRAWVEGYCAKYNQPIDGIPAMVDNWIAKGILLLAQIGTDGPVIAGVVQRDAHYASENARYFQDGIYNIYNSNTSLAEYQKYKPNDLLVWEAALRAKSQGFREFVLGFEGAQFKREFSRRRLVVEEWRAN